MPKARAGVPVQPRRRTAVSGAAAVRPGPEGRPARRWRCAHLLRLPPEGVTNALAIASAPAEGLLEVAVSDEETMVEPLHIGRAAESGLLAARLAAGGGRGPWYLLDGRCGLLDGHGNTVVRAQRTARRLRASAHGPAHRMPRRSLERVLGGETRALERLAIAAQRDMSGEGAAAAPAP